MYIYQSHLGGIYTSEYQYDYDDLYCETCGDSDNEIGNFESAVDVLKYMADDIDADDGHGGWAIDMLLEDLACFDDVPSLEDAIRIVKENRSEEDEEDT